MTHVPWHELVDDGPAEDTGPEADERTLVSVGIDVGTTTTHLMLTELTVQSGTGHYEDVPTVVGRQELYRSPIEHTPYESGSALDADAIGEFVERCYRTAGVTPEEVDTGAVLVTGEARRKHNAAAISELVADRVGRFVCAMAGPNLEAVMAAHGSGAVDKAVRESRDLLHVDVGGGTTKFAWIREGFIEATAAIAVGGRAVELDEDGTVTRVSDAGARVAERLGVTVEPGTTLDEETRTAVGRELATLVFEVIDGEHSDAADALLVTDPPDRIPVDAITWSGGVSEYVYDRRPGFFGDIAPELGAALRERVVDPEKADAGIRATVSGSTSEHVQVSGDTVEITDPGLLPLRDVPMVPLVLDTGDSADELVRQLEAEADRYDVVTLDRPVAFAVHVHGRVGYAFLDRLAAAIVRAHPGDTDVPLVLAFDDDLGMSVGRMVADRTDSPVVTVDNVGLDEFGYLDVGGLDDGEDVPLVTMKSLVF